MERYHVISSKKVTLFEMEDEQEQKVDTAFKLENKNIEVVEEFYSSTPDEVVEIPFSTCEDNSLEYLTKNDSNAEVQQNSLTNNYFGSETAEFDQNNSMQLGKLSTSHELSSDIKSAIDFPDASTEIHMYSESDEASENGDPHVIGRSVGKAHSQCPFEQYASYICPVCGIVCGPYDKWKLHTATEHGFGLLEAANVQSIVNKHGELCHKCRDCPKTFKLTQGFSLLILHRIAHLPFKYYVACCICSARYRSKSNLKQHLQRDHKDLNVNTKPRFQDSALEHIRLFCPVCKEEQSNISDWRAHMKEQHDYYNKARSKFEPAGKNIYICSVCKLKVREVHLVEHMQTHEDFKPFLCTYCNDSTSQLKIALSHVRNKHLRTPKELLWKCMLCKASFKSPYRREEHYLFTHKVGSQKCKVCKKKFSSSSSLLSHINLTNHHTLKSRT